MTYIEPYWLHDFRAPFATLLRLIDTYCNPNADEDAYRDLISMAHDPNPGDEMRLFKEELRQLLAGDIAQLPKGALWTAAEFGDGTDEAFLRRLWRDLYGDEPVGST